MNITGADIFYSICYGLNIVSFMTTKMRWLRLGVFISTIGFLAFSFYLQRPSMIFWNGLFVVVNGYQLIRLLLDTRDISLGEELERIHADNFGDLSKNEFLFFWAIGSEANFENTALVQQGQDNDSLYFLIHGDLEVRKNQHKVSNVGPCNFVGETSFLTGQPATADTVAVGKARMREWNKNKIYSLKKLKPDLFHTLLLILGRDVSRKLSRWE